MEIPGGGGRAPCAHLPCSIKICYCYLGWAVTEERKMSPGALFQQSSPGQLHFREQQVLKPEVAVSSVLLISCKYFIKAAAWQNPTKSGLSAWEWQQQGGCRHVRGCVFYHSFPLFISMCLHFSSFTCSLHTSLPWPGELTSQACVFWSICRSERKKKKPHWESDRGLRNTF